MSLIALTRNVPPSIVNCELTHLEREPIDIPRASEQHDYYEEGLTALGCTIHRLPDLPHLPDSVFVEDTAIVLREVAIITRPGAESRRLEISSVKDALSLHREIVSIETPGTLDGGDVLIIDSSIFIGVSSRTNAEGIRQLEDIVSAYGYTVRPVNLSGCLHLKSAVSRAADDAVLINPEWIDSSPFASLHRIEVHPAEPFAANALLIGETLIYPGGYEETLRRLDRNHISTYLVDMDELQKAEGGVSCCSILVETLP